MKNFVVAVVVAVLLQLCSCANAINDGGNEPRQINVTNNNNLRDFPEPPPIQITTDDEWLPWKSPLHLLSSILEDDEEKICREDSSMDEFPDDLFSQEQRMNGAIVLHFIGVIYFFTFTGMLINYYYLPSVQCICDALNITPDVGAAVFMSTATCTPELFTNLIGTFIADSDMGIGAVIGSLMFNMLGVSAVASFATSTPVQMDWVPITRDCVVFAANIIVLIGTTWDGYIHWYEALIIMIFAIPYYVIMFQSRRISAFLKRKFEVEYGCCNRNISGASETTDVEKKGKDNAVFKYSTTTMDQIPTVTGKVEEEKVDEKALAETAQREAEEKEAHNALKQQRKGLWPPPNDAWPRVVFWYYTWLIRLVLRCTVVDVKKYPKWFAFSFIMSIVWIGVMTYLIFFMLIIISYTFSIPESVMGVTVFAIGGCTPELITGFITARQGNSNVGVSNSVGASSLAIIIALGVPWFFRAVISSPGHERPYVALHTNGMEYIILSLLLLTLCFYLILYFRRFILTKITGGLLILTYAVFITIAVLMEVGVFFDLICIPYY
ncbi:sodium/potassium/calcium exchanger 3-like [Bradysia coprophila]|uniref:sodium/potassium/calcium exchanger 3-like n=1 Tax=Bradysia coprophila TaxID=38358 RepID=UPI00187DADCE|nr:sodium/potassium/calcium exchanger 3-like [Bradysia coprophila]XP_037038338.1 sodium/potassium/calcium exchanger 3-like [Bradysia coprophila]